LSLYRITWSSTTAIAAELFMSDHRSPIVKQMKNEFLLNQQHPLQIPINKVRKYY